MNDRFYFSLQHKMASNSEIDDLQDEPTIVKSDNDVVAATDSNCVVFNFRGQVRWISKEHLEYFPYLYTLVHGDLTMSAKDGKGRFLVDENYNIISYLIDKYRYWLEQKIIKPDKTTIGCVDTLVIAVARAMGCNNDFVTALSVDKHDELSEEKCFKCYYCDNVFLKDSLKTSKPKPCTYHTRGCTCVPSKYGSEKRCAEVPFHTPIRIEMAKSRLNRPILFEEGYEIQVNE
ncbi:MAG: hypothetical protein ACMG6E_06965 [Candidatus Roizmanbacteria bacterium]